MKYLILPIILLYYVVFVLGRNYTLDNIESKMLECGEKVYLGVESISKTNDKIDRFYGLHDNARRYMDWEIHQNYINGYFAVKHLRCIKKELPLLRLNILDLYSRE